MATITKEVIAFGSPRTIACDAKCDKAWGHNNRPKIDFDDDNPDDYAYLPDQELGTAPADPGTYEGFQAKPTREADRLNKWCFRECERSVSVERGGARSVLPDFSKRFYNIPSRQVSEEARA